MRTLLVAIFYLHGCTLTVDDFGEYGARLCKDKDCKEQLFEVVAKQDFNDTDYRGVSYVNGSSISVISVGPKFHWTVKVNNKSGFMDPRDMFDDDYVQFIKSAYRDKVKLFFVADKNEESKQLLVSECLERTLPCSELIFQINATKKWYDSLQRVERSDGGSTELNNQAEVPDGSGKVVSEDVEPSKLQERKLRRRRQASTDQPAADRMEAPDGTSREQQALTTDMNVTISPKAVMPGSNESNLPPSIPAAKSPVQQSPSKVDNEDVGSKQVVDVASAKNGSLISGSNRTAETSRVEEEAKDLNTSEGGVKNEGSVPTVTKEDGTTLAVEEKATSEPFTLSDGHTVSDNHGQVGQVHKQVPAPSTGNEPVAANDQSLSADAKAAAESAHHNEAVNDKKVDTAGLTVENQTSQPSNEKEQVAVTGSAETVFVSDKQVDTVGLAIEKEPPEPLTVSKSIPNVAKVAKSAHETVAHGGEQVDSAQPTVNKEKPKLLTTGPSTVDALMTTSSTNAVATTEKVPDSTETVSIKGKQVDTVGLAVENQTSQPSNKKEPAAVTNKAPERKKESAGTVSVDDKQVDAVRLAVEKEPPEPLAINKSTSNMAKATKPAHETVAHDGEQVDSAQPTVDKEEPKPSTTSPSTTTSADADYNSVTDSPTERLLNDDLEITAGQIGSKEMHSDFESNEAVVDRTEPVEGGYCYSPSDTNCLSSNDGDADGNDSSRWRRAMWSLFGAFGSAEVMGQTVLPWLTVASILLYLTDCALAKEFKRRAFASSISVVQRHVDGMMAGLESGDSLPAMKNLQKELEGSKEEVARLKGRMKELEAEVDSYKEANELLEKDVAKFIDEQAGLKEKDERLAALKREYASLEKALRCKEEEVDKLERESLERVAEACTVRQQFEAAESRCVKLEEKARSLNAELVALREVNEEQEQELSELQTRFGNAEAEATGLKEIVSKLALLRSKEEGSSNANDWTCEELDASSFSEVWEEILNCTKLYASIGQMKQRIGELEEAVSAERNGRSSLQEEMERLLNERDEMKAAVQQAETQTMEAATRLKILEEFFESRQRELQKQLGVQLSLTHKRAEQLETFEDQTKGLREEKEHAEQMVAELRSEIEALEKENKKQRLMLERAAQESWLLSKRHQRELEAVRLENNSLRSRLINQGIELPGMSDVLDGQPMMSGMPMLPSIPLPPLPPLPMVSDHPTLPPLPLTMPGDHGELEGSLEGAEFESFNPVHWNENGRYFNGNRYSTTPSPGMLTEPLRRVRSVRGRRSNRDDTAVHGDYSQKCGTLDYRSGEMGSSDPSCETDTSATSPPYLAASGVPLSVINDHSCRPKLIRKK